MFYEFDHHHEPPMNRRRRQKGLSYYRFIRNGQRLLYDVVVLPFVAVMAKGLEIIISGLPALRYGDDVIDLKIFLRSADEATIMVSFEYLKAKAVGHLAPFHAAYGAVDVFV